MKKIFMFLMLVMGIVFGANAQDTIYHCDTIKYDTTEHGNMVIYTGNELVATFNCDSNTDSVVFNFIAQNPQSNEFHQNPLSNHTDINVSLEHFNTDSSVCWHEFHGANDTVVMMYDTIWTEYETGDSLVIDTIIPYLDTIELDSSLYQYGYNTLHFPDTLFNGHIQGNVYLYMRTFENRLYNGEQTCYIIRNPYALKYWHEVVDTTTQSINDISADFNIDIYPNPSNGIVNINGDYTTLSVFDAVGRVMYKSNNKVNQINVSKYPNGLYFISFDGNKTVKFIKN